MSASATAQTPAKSTLEEMTSAVLYCRSERHAWDRDSVKDFDIVVSAEGYVLQWRREVACEGCGAARVQTLDHAGCVVKAHIRYPQGYLNAEGGRLHASTVRRQQMLNAGFKVAPE